MRSKKRPASPCQAATGLSLTKLQLPNYNVEASALALENQRHSAIDWLAARANVATSTARLHAELFGFAGCR